MSGHSKWHNIQAKKSKTDAARAKIFTKIGKEMMIAIREGGPNPESTQSFAILSQKQRRTTFPTIISKERSKKAPAPMR